MAPAAAPSSVDVRWWISPVSGWACTSALTPPAAPKRSRPTSRRPIDRSQARAPGSTTSSSATAATPGTSTRGAVLELTRKPFRGRAAEPFVRRQRTGRAICGVRDSVVPRASVSRTRRTRRVLFATLVVGDASRGGAMNELAFDAVVAFAAFFAGVIGALIGLGGGVIITPMLVLFFKIDIRYAMGAALASVIATSYGAAAACLRGGISKMRIGLFLCHAKNVSAVWG